MTYVTLEKFPHKGITLGILKKHGLKYTYILISYRACIRKGKNSRKNIEIPLIYFTSEEIQQKSERENSKLQKMIFLPHGSVYLQDKTSESFT